MPLAPAWLRPRARRSRRPRLVRWLLLALLPVGLVYGATSARKLFTLACAGQLEGFEAHKVLEESDRVVFKKPFLYI